MESPALLAQELQTPKKEALGQGGLKRAGARSPSAKETTDFFIGSSAGGSVDQYGGLPYLL